MADATTPAERCKDYCHGPFVHPYLVRSRLNSRQRFACAERAGTGGCGKEFWASWSRSSTSRGCSRGTIGVQ